MNNPKVSIISPCHNGEKFITRFLQSLLTQTYDNIEAIIINDGSSDSTEDIALSFEEKFKNRGFGFKYIYQNNAGQSAAINKGLEIFSGDYLTWLDSDDYLPPYAIEKKVNFLNSNPSCGTVISKVQVVQEDTLSNLFIESRRKPHGKDEIFFDLIKGNNVFYSPGGYMVRTSMFRKVMPNPIKIEAPREIGQNFQLLLPIVYKYPVGYIDDICYYYVIRKNSHSHTRKSYEQLERKAKIANHTLKKITSALTNNPNEIEKINAAIHYRFLLTRLNNIYTYPNKENLNLIISEIYKYNYIDYRTKQLIRRIKYPLYDYLIRGFQLLKKKLH